MKRSWLPLLTVLVLGALAGVAIAGRPSPVDSRVISPVVPTVVVATTQATSTTAGAVVSSTSTATSVTRAPSTTVAPIDRSALRVVAANGTSTSGLAGTTSDQLRFLGYTQVTPTDAIANAIFSVVYHREGFEAAANQLAVDLELPAGAVAPLRAAPVSKADADGDLILVIGNDLST